MQTWLTVRLRVPGFHQWKKAPKEYAYLRPVHRHEFHIKLEIRVDNNRSYEFIDIKDKLHDWLLDTFTYNCNSITLKSLPTQSCEALAQAIAEDFVAPNYLCVETKVTVEEDGENGARVELRSEG